MARLLYGRDQSVTTYHRGIHLLLPSLDDSCQGCYLPGIVLGAENWSRPRWRWGWQRRYSDSTWTWSWETPFYPYSSYQSWALEIQDPQGYTSFLTYRILMRWLWPLSLRVKRMKSTLNKKKKKKALVQSWLRSSAIFLWGRNLNECSCNRQSYFRISDKLSFSVGETYPSKFHPSVYFKG